MHYGDLTISASTPNLLRELEQNSRHWSREHVTDLWIRTGMAAQAILDDDSCRDPAVQAQVHALLRRAARLVIEEASFHEYRNAVIGLRDFNLPEALRMKIPEGFSFYSVFPESYLESAHALRNFLGEAELRVVGIRSIGTALGSIVAEAAGACDFWTVRPVGHPFQREISADDDFKNTIVPESHYAVVDEGPGLSGSSFASVAAWLVARGVPWERIHFLPAHPHPPGNDGSDSVRKIWSQVRRWNANEFRSDQDPRWNYCGLGPAGAIRREIAIRLSKAGWIPEVLGFRYGGILQAPVEGIPLDETPRRDRIQALSEIARYLAFRARALPPPIVQGAPLEKLHRGREQIDGLSRLVRPVYLDGDLGPGKWRCQSNGKLLKTKAWENAVSHEFIGPQDSAWDIAGVIVEFELSDSEERLFLRALANEGLSRDSRLLAFYRAAYRAFRPSRNTRADQ